MSEKQDSVPGKVAKVAIGKVARNNNHDQH
jgi:hypothetical protein